jgi:DNA topoisomerase IA
MSGVQNIKYSNASKEPPLLISLTTLAPACLSSIRLTASKGLDACQAEYAIKKYRSHRRIGAKIMMDPKIICNPE